MKFLKPFLAALLMSAPLQSAAAAPAVPGPAQQATKALIPFDPPLDTVLRYRWEKSIEKDGRTDLHWSIADYRFEQTDNGYRLTVTPVSSGSNETDPTKIAMMKRIEELTRRPFVLRLDDLGSIQEVEDADFYWSTIFRVLKEELARVAGNDTEAEIRAAMENVLAMFERMPAEVRQAVMTEEVQPLVEFANTETEIGKPITATIESSSPFGGKINRDVTINLAKVEDAMAFLTIRSAVPREQLDKLMKSFVSQLTTLKPEQRKAAEDGLAALKGFRHETLSDYEVSTVDGMLERFQSTETVEANDKNKAKKKITTRSMQRID